MFYLTEIPPRPAGINAGTVTEYAVSMTITGGLRPQPFNIVDDLPKDQAKALLWALNNPPTLTALLRSPSIREVVGSGRTPAFVLPSQEN